MTPRVVWPLDALLGEGPIWLADERALLFVDIKRGSLHRWWPDDARGETVMLGDQPSFVVPLAGGGLLVGSGHGLYGLQGDNLGDPLHTIAMPAHNRTNDATVDAHGRLWFGTMDDTECMATGSMWCLDRGVLHHAGGRAVVTNGPAISGDGKFLYHVASCQRRILRFELGEDHALSYGEVFLQLGEAEGAPDGVVLDSEDCLWVALWDGWAVRRYAPDGMLLAQIDFPCARITKLAFGGDDLKTAFVTSARVGLSDEQLAEQPLAGALFSFAVPVAGRILPSVRLT